MSRSWIWLLPLCAVLGLGACGDSGSENDPDPDDGSNNTDDPTKDPDDPDKELGSSELADLCSKNEECSSGLCVSLGQGVNDSLCSKRCEEASDCGESSVWDCTEVDTSADQINVCVPKDLCLDNDNDGYGVGPGCLGPDCDDNDPTVYFGAPEICDGKDNDCNDEIDDNPVDVGIDCDTSYEGVCKTGVSYCDDGELKCEALIQPGQQREICDGLDNDCDGYVDESPLDPGGDDGNYVDGTGRACSKGGSEECLNGLSVCDPDQGIICESNDNILDDTCDGIDDNCSGRIDDDVEGLNEPCIAGEGECQVHGHTVCDADPYDPPICDAEPDDSKISPEICDYKDNNCDGDVDEGFVNDDGVYYRVEHCGACDLDCNDRWVDNDFAHTVTPTCDVQGQNTQCGYECKPGFIDADGDASNGCELEENPEALYVAPVNKGGSDNGFCGDYDRPCATISRAIELLDDYDAANEPRTEILVAEGIYREGITLPDGVDVKGGHNALNWLNNVEEYRTIIVGSVNDDGDRYTVLAEDIQQPTELSGFTILGEDAQNGANSIGVFVRNASDKLTIKDNVIRAGVGGQGVSGDAGSDGANGTDGLPGLAGAEINVSSCSSSDERDGGQAGTSSCGSSDVSGGLGAAAACPSYGQPGATASDGKGAAPGSGGLTAAGRGLYQNACYPHPDHISESFPSDGAFGDAGTDGGGGDGADDSEGTIDSDGMWRGVRGAQGASGDNGSGGGGGGASHGTMKCDSIDADGRIFEDCDTVGLIGSSGGGGGAGGCSGNGADGGGGGGGSFSIYVYADASGASLPTITDNTLERNLGGQGGDGGIGGRGGDGGGGGVGGPAPAQPTYCPQAGRSGGNGGRGGHGGGGGGGAGGASFDIAIFGLSANASDLQSANEFSIDSDEDTGGSGGPGGGSMGQSGSQGTTGSFGQFINP